MAHSVPKADIRTRLQDWIPKLVLSPSLAAMFVFVYGFIAFTVYLSFTGSKMLPSYDWVGFENYAKLWGLSHWWTAITNLGIFASLYIVICTVIGLGLAIFLDQKIRGEGVLRPIYLYPMALSFIVTGTAWKWILDPGIGLYESDIHSVRIHKSSDGFAGGWKLKGVRVVVNGHEIYNKQSINKWLEDNDRTWTDTI